MRDGLLDDDEEDVEYYFLYIAIFIGGRAFFSTTSWILETLFS